MRMRFIFVIFCISFASYLNISGINAQILKDNKNLSILKKTVDLIYDFKFENDPQRATKYRKTLYELYLENIQNKAFYTKKLTPAKAI